MRMRKDVLFPGRRNGKTKLPNYKAIVPCKCVAFKSTDFAIY